MGLHALHQRIAKVATANKRHVAMPRAWALVARVIELACKARVRDCLSGYKSPVAMETCFAAMMVRVRAKPKQHLAHCARSIPIARVAYAVANIASRRSVNPAWTIWNAARVSAILSPKRANRVLRPILRLVLPVRNA
jgi:hypothetical protein